MHFKLNNQMHIVETNHSVHDIGGIFLEFAHSHWIQNPISRRDIIDSASRHGLRCILMFATWSCDPLVNTNLPLSRREWSDASIEYTALARNDLRPFAYF